VGITEGQQANGVQPSYLFGSQLIGLGEKRIAFSTQLTARIQAPAENVLVTGSITTECASTLNRDGRFGSFEEKGGNDPLHFNPSILF
tara:strand:- start:364 stop:627 length:264 start_codon:yes stop_codon:yes gene_type:complete